MSTSKTNSTNKLRHQSIDAFIDFLEEGKETVLVNSKFDTPVSKILQWEFETRNLPTIELSRFDGDPCKWPDFIQNFKLHIHDKKCFNDSIRLERLKSVLDGEAKRIVAAIGQGGMFYASALKLLKRNFGNPVVVSYMKLKTVLHLPQIVPNDYNGLRMFHQKLKTTVTWLNSMEYKAAINSTENVTKAVMRLPKYMRSKFYRDFEGKLYSESDYNLEIFERWLGNKLDEIYNPIAAIIESEEKKRTTREQNSSNRNLPKDTRQFYALNGITSDQLKCWICQKGHKVTDCDEIKNKPYSEKLKLIRDKNLCFNCLSNTHIVTNCKSKISCKVTNCQKRHHTLLHPPPSNPTPTTDENDSSINSLQKQETEKPNVEYKVGNQSIKNNEQLFLQVVPITLINDSYSIETNALLDNGSDTTLIRTDIVKRLQLKGEKRDINVSGAISQPETIQSELVNVTVRSSTSNNTVQLKPWSIKDLDIPPINYDMNKIKSSYQHLKNIDFPKVKNEK